MVTESYANWQQHGAVIGAIENVQWSEKDYNNLNWFETFMIDQIPQHDNWNTFATQQKLDSEMLYKSWGVVKENTKHYACLRPKLNNKTKLIISKYFDKNHNYNFLKLTSGNQLVWHYDTFATFVKFNNITQDQIKDVCRTVVMMSDWDRGQILQVGNKVYTHWKKGNTYTWKSDVWHGMCNFGPSDCVVAQITFLDENNDYA